VSSFVGKVAKAAPQIVDLVDVRAFTEAGQGGKPAAGDIVSHPGCAAKKLDPRPEAKSSHKRRGCHPRNYSWSELMRRVFALDVLECPRCFGRMRIVTHSPQMATGRPNRV
jgi:hypothetical protein